MVLSQTQMVGDMAGLRPYAHPGCAEICSRGGKQARNAQSDGLSGQTNSAERSCVYHMSACVRHYYEEDGEATHAAS